MITIQFQALSNYEKEAADEQAVTELFRDIQKTYSRLFENEEVVIDVFVDQNPHTLYKKITVVGYIPKHGKFVSEAEEKTFLQAISGIKQDVERFCRQQT